MNNNINYITSIGVEIEGGGNIHDVEDLIRSFNDHRIDVGTDGSVYVECDHECDEDDDCCYGWRSSLEIKYWVYINEIELLFKFIDELFDKDFYQNHTCGNHIHVRIPHDLVYIVSLYADYFVNYFTKKYIVFAKSFKDKDSELYDRMMQRLSNRYCRRYRNPWDLYFNVVGKGSRYKIVNFISLYEPQRTIEFRIFPYVIESNELKMFIDFTIRTVNKIIDKILKLHATAYTPIVVEHRIDFETDRVIEGEVDVL